MRSRIAYFLKMLPAQSTTFIHREIDYLRAIGHEVYLFPVWKADPAALAGTIGENRRYNFERFSLLYPLWAFAFPYYFLRRPDLCARLFSRYRKLYGIKYFVKSIETALLIQARRPAVIHAHTLSLCASRARIVGRLLDIPYVITAHGSDLLLFPPEDARELIADARAVITPSLYNKKRLIEIAGPDTEEKIRVIGHAVDCGFFSPKTNLRREHDPALLIMVGGLVPVKGHRTMLRAAARLRDNGTAFRLTIVGEGIERAALVAETARLGLADIVRFAGALYDQELRDALRRADIFVSSSISEGLPVALLEAMAVGLCVVVPRITGIPEVVKNGENGLLFSRGNAKGLAERIQTAVLDRSMRKRLGINARKTVISRFERSMVYREIIGLLFE